MTRNRIIATIALIGLPLGVGAFMWQAREQDGARLFAQVLQRVTDSSVDSMSMNAVYEKAARGLIKGLNDPYADLYSPEELKSFQRNTLGNNYGGVGMQIESQDGFITVARVFPNTPGESGGVVAGDRILAVDSVPVTGLKLDAVSAKLTGTPGTTVNVIFTREGVGERIHTKFTRAIIRVPAVPFTLMLDGKIGYVPLQRFNESAAQDIERAVSDLKTRGAVGYVLDLRGNPGGSLDQSLEIGNLFLKKGQELARVKHRGRPPEVYNANRTSIVDSTRMIVLIDGSAASASEIVAGTLQDHDRALVVGTTSFGKGLVQTLYPLEGGWSLKLTTGKWYTPSGRSIQKEHKQLEDSRFVEDGPAADSAETDSARKARPMFRSDAGRTVYGGGGIIPDVIVPADTLPAEEQEFLKAIGAKFQQFYVAVYGFSREMKGNVKPGFIIQPEWRNNIYDRLVKAGVTLDRKVYDRASNYVERQLTIRLSSLAFGDSAAFRRISPIDNQLQSALALLRKGTTQRELLTLATAQKPSR